MHDTDDANTRVGNTDCLLGRLLHSTTRCDIRQRHPTTILALQHCLNCYLDCPPQLHASPGPAATGVAMDSQDGPTASPDRSQPRTGTWARPRQTQHLMLQRVPYSPTRLTLCLVVIRGRQRHSKIWCSARREAHQVGRDRQVLRAANATCRPTAVRAAPAP